jgi:hypothetical protein
LPTDWRVEVVAVPARVMAALAYSGGWTRADHLARLADMRAALDAAGARPVGAPRLACYNSRFSLPIWRRNELLVEVTTAAR